MKKILIIASATVLLILVAYLLAVLLFPRDRIISLVEASATEAARLPVTVENASISIFPLGVQLSGITVGSPVGEEPPLAEIQSVTAGISPYGFLMRRVHVSSLRIDRPVVYVTTYPDGTTNLPDPVEEPEEEPEDLPFNVIISRLIVRRGELGQIDMAEGTRISVGDVRADISLSVSRDLASMRSSGTIRTGNFAMHTGESAFSLPELETVFNYTLNGDLTAGNFVLADSRLHVGRLIADVEANVNEWEELNFAVNAPDRSFQEVIALVPQDLFPENTYPTARGSFSFDAEGTINLSEETPEMTYNGGFTTADASLSFRGRPQRFENIMVDVNFTEENVGIEALSFTVGGSAASLSGSILDWPGARLLNIASSGSIDLGDIFDAVTIQEGRGKGSGLVSWNTVLKGSLEEISTLSAEGNINARDGVVELPETLIHPLSFDFAVDLARDAAVIRYFNAVTGPSDFSFTGRLSNYTALLEENGRRASLTGTLKSRAINLNELFPEPVEPPPEPVTLREIIETIPVPPNLDVNIGLEIGTLAFWRFTGGPVRGRIIYRDGRAELSSLAIDVWQGRVTGGAALDFSNIERIAYSGNVNIGSIQLGSMIDQLTESGRVFNGDFNGNLQFSSFGGETPEILQNLTGSGKMSLRQGSISEWDFARSLEGRLPFLNLTNMSISNLSSSVRIDQGRFITPDMDISTNFGRVSFSGSTGFDRTIDYNFTLRLDREASELAVKNLPALRGLVAVENIELPVRATGSLDSPSFVIDTSAAERRLREDLKKRGQDLLEKEEERLRDRGRELLDRLVR